MPSFTQAASLLNFEETKNCSNFLIQQIPKLCLCKKRATQHFGYSTSHEMGLKYFGIPGIPIGKKAPKYILKAFWEDRQCNIGGIHNFWLQIAIAFNTRRDQARMTKFCELIRHLSMHFWKSPHLTSVMPLGYRSL